MTYSPVICLSTGLKRKQKEHVEMLWRGAVLRERLAWLLIPDDSGTIDSWPIHGLQMRRHVCLYVSVYVLMCAVCMHVFHTRMYVLHVQRACIACAFSQKSAIHEQMTRSAPGRLLIFFLCPKDQRHIYAYNLLHASCFDIPYRKY